MKSFRLRIAVLCAVLAGAVLVAFAGGAWWIAAQERTREFDQRVHELARRLLRRLPQDVRPVNIAEAMEAALREENADGFVVLMSNQPSQVLWCSTGEMPAGLSFAAQVPGSDEMARMRPPPGGQPGQPGPFFQQGRRDNLPGPPRDGSAVPQRQDDPDAAGGGAPPVQRQDNNGQPQRADAAGPRLPAPRQADGEELRRAAAAAGAPASVPAATGAAEPERPARVRQGMGQGQGGMGQGGMGQRPPFMPDPQRGRAGFDADVAGEPHRFAAASHFRFTMIAGLPRGPLAAQWRSDGLVLAAATGGGLLLVGAGAWLLSRRITLPLRTVVETAGGLNASALDRRVPLSGREDREIRELITVLNSMMDRLQASFGQAVRFTADASHELQTPLAVMQATIDDALRHPPTDENRTDMLESLARETARLKSITRSLLVLSRADAGRLETDRETFSLSEELTALAEDAEILCQDAGLSFAADLAPDVEVRADRAMLRQIFQNLLTNAVRYNEPAGRILLRLRTLPGPGSGCRAEVLLFNTGPGIDPEDQSRVFDRFFRGDKARRPSASGLGLGLNIARELARANDAELRLDRSGPGGTEFVLTLPAAAP